MGVHAGTPREIWAPGTRRAEQDHPPGGLPSKIPEHSTASKPGREGQERGGELGLFTQASWVFCTQVMDFPIRLLLLKTPDPRSYGLVHKRQRVPESKATINALEKTTSTSPTSEDEIQQGNHEAPLPLLHKELSEPPSQGIGLAT